MNAAEALSREIERVTLLRERYRSMAGMPQANMAPAIAMMTAAVERGHLAAGSNDAMTVRAAIEDLKGFTR